MKMFAIKLPPEYKEKVMRILNGFSWQIKRNYRRKSLVNAVRFIIDEVAGDDEDGS